MKKIICFILILSSLLCFRIYNTFTLQAEPYKASVVIERTSNRILSEYNCNDRLPMASTTKIMTALVTLENCEDISSKVNVDDRAVGIEGTSIYLRKGEVLTVEELLYGLILPSGNDASMALAYYIGKGNLEDFVKLMNDKAESLGLKNTHFDNPHGLDSKTHYTSAYDLAVITSEAMKKATFREIVSTKNKQITGNEEVAHRFLRNKQRLLKTLEGCNGVKTGFTDNAGRCLVTSCKRDDMEVISVMLNCPDMFNESARIIENAYKTYKMVSILEPYSYITNIPVNEGELESVKVYSMKGFKYPLKEDERVNIHVERELPEVLDAPIEKEQTIGEIKIFYDKDLIFSEKIYTMESVRSLDIKDKMKDIIDKWFYE